MVGACMQPLPTSSKPCIYHDDGEMHHHRDEYMAMASYKPAHSRQLKRQYILMDQTHRMHTTNLKTNFTSAAPKDKGGRGC